MDAFQYGPRQLEGASHLQDGTDAGISKSSCKHKRKVAGAYQLCFFYPHNNGISEINFEHTQLILMLYLFVLTGKNSLSAQLVSTMWPLSSVRP